MSGGSFHRKSRDESVAAHPQYFHEPGLQPIRPMAGWDVSKQRDTKYMAAIPQIERGTKADRTGYLSTNTPTVSMRLVLLTPVAGPIRLAARKSSIGLPIITTARRAYRSPMDTRRSINGKVLKWQRSRSPIATGWARPARTRAIPKGTCNGWRKTQRSAANNSRQTDGWFQERLRIRFSHFQS